MKRCVLNGNAHVGAERGVNCEHMQAMVTNMLQRHWEWQEDRRVLDMEPKPESLWLITTYKHEDMRTLRVGGRDKVWDLPFCEVFVVLGYRFHRDGKRFQGAERSMCKALRSWWRSKYIHRSKTATMTTKCERVDSHVYSTVPNWQYQFAVEWRH